MNEQNNLNVEDWKFQLEAELLVDECDFGTLRNICKNHTLPASLRKKAWIVLLGANKHVDSLKNWDDIYDLINQSEIRNTANEVVDNLNVDDGQKVIFLAELESVLTFFIKTSNDKSIKPYWKDVLSVLMLLRMEKNELYTCFSTIAIFLRSETQSTELPYDLFRLILLYHEPELCSFLESKKLPPKYYCLKWLNTLLASSKCNLEVISALWDVYFQQADPFLIFFICLGFLINSKEALMNLKDSDKDQILEYILNIPTSLTVEDVEDICTIAQHYSALTPYTTRQEFKHLLFKPPPYVKAQPVPEEIIALPLVNLSHALCLSVSVEELLRSKNSKDGVISYFVVDCRPPEQYNNGHHPTAFHLDANLMLQDPVKFETAVSALLAAQQNALSINSSAGGKHLCLVGSGRMTEDRYLLMIAANFLRKHHKYLSHLKDGYAGLHNALHDNLDKGLSQHNSKRCIMCCVSVDEHDRSIGSNSRGDSENYGKVTSSLLGKFSTVMKVKTQEIKQKLNTYINSPTLSPDDRDKRHVSPKELNAKRYRNLPALFSVADEYDASSDEGLSDEDGDDDSKTVKAVGGIQECVSVDAWCNKVGALGRFPCSHFVTGSNLSFPSHIVVTASHLYILRHLRHHNNDHISGKFNKTPPNRSSNLGGGAKEVSGAPLLAYVACTQPLNAIVKITSRKRNPEIITLKYGRVLTSDNDLKSTTYPNKECDSSTSPEDPSLGASISIESWDKLHIPQAGDATKLIKRLIVEQMEREEEGDKSADEKINEKDFSNSPSNICTRDHNFDEDLKKEIDVEKDEN